MLAALQEAVLSVDTLGLSPDTTRAQGLEQRLAQRRRSINIRCVNAGTGDCVSCSLLMVSQALLGAEDLTSEVFRGSLARGRTPGIM